MKAGFTFKGQHSSEFEGVTVRTSDRPVCPETKEEVLSPTNGDGERSFARANPYGREFYKSKVYQMEMNIIADNLYDLQGKITRLSRWIMGSGELIFDDTPLVKWTARIVDTVQYTPEHGGKHAKFIVSYKVEPFGELVFDTIDGPCLGDAVEIGADIPLDISMSFTFEGTGTYTVKNIGDVPVRPIITVENATKAVTLYVNGVKLKVPPDAVIDCENYYVKNLQGKSLMTQIEGDFFELKEGDNAMTVAAEELSASIAVEVRYNPRYIHSADMFNTGLGG